MGTRYSRNHLLPVARPITAMAFNVIREREWPRLIKGPFPFGIVPWFNMLLCTLSRRGHAAQLLYQTHAGPVEPECRDQPVVHIVERGIRDLDVLAGRG